jgi:hypothetical protein
VNLLARAAKIRHLCGTAAENGRTKIKFSQGSGLKDALKNEAILKMKTF